MSDFINYKGLRDTVADYLERDDVIDNIPTFVATTTRHASRNLELPSMIVGNVVDVYGNGTVAIPRDLAKLKAIDWLTFESLGVDFAGVEEVKVTARKNLVVGSLYEYKKTLEEGITSILDTPTSFAREGINYKIYPLPLLDEISSAGTLQSTEFVGKVNLVYYQMPTPLINDGDTNWLLDLAPEVYLYGTLARAFEYIRDYETSAFWDSRYKDALADIQAWSAKADENGGTISVSY
ncbi:head completion adaptor [Vibrio phage 1.262.O._10N.286.51.A9]|nr:head completion adaptor [Vibrio phage 1.262.O._10N.286.51.A9]